ncbi:YgjV family protein [Arsukibacterium indicum]|uniref:YgjV family protein n=1 Tax=Arsukibacterium indicum TaxID=2848612 RepID=A0ABS6MKN3_9GAMM|nr:YgjV family protein [Arsukibacterium indicum]MBV2129150.1 YgjV family protein [Arsukibacterium indicum]
MPELSVLFLGSQLLAAIAFGCGIFAFWQQQRSSMLRFWFISAVLNASHFGLLGQYEAALFVGLTAIRFLVAAIQPRQHWMLLFMAGATAILLTSYSSPLNLLPYAAAMLGTYGSFQTRLGRVRLCMAIGASCWIIHNMLVGSPVAVLMELAFLLSNLVGFLRARRLAAALAGSSQSG